MTYEPDFNDPRFRRRALAVLEFVDLYVPRGKIRPVAQTQLTKTWGNTGRPLARYLKELLLKCEDSHWNMATGQCKKYSQNTQNVQWLRQQLGVSDSVVVKPQEQQQLESGHFDYIEKSNRSYHRLQNLPKYQRRTLLSRHQMRHEYDIECCALSLVLQHSRQLGLKNSTPLLDQIQNDRTQVRQQLAEQLNLTVSQIKSIMAKMLNGGRVSAWYGTAIFEEVNNNPLMIKAINSNQLIQQYKQELKDMWMPIRSSLNLNKGVRFNSKKKTEIYNQLEKSVTDQIKKYLKKNKIKHFFIHDGWSCDRAIDLDELTSHVRRTSGFVVRLEWTIYEGDVK